MRIRTRGTDLVAVNETEIGKGSTGIEVEKTGSLRVVKLLHKFFAF